jgi:hypothetical protein
MCVIVTWFTGVTVKMCTDRTHTCITVRCVMCFCILSFISSVIDYHIIVWILVLACLLVCWSIYLSKLVIWAM